MNQAALNRREKNDMLRCVLNIVNHSILQRSVGSFSCVVGLVCYALSTSFKSLFGEWNPTKIVLYTILSFIISVVVLFAGKSRVPGGVLKPHVEFLVLMLTSLYSFFADQSTKGKPDALSVISSGAFALTSLCLSRQMELGFEVGLFSFFLGCVTVQLMKIHLIFILVAAAFCYPLVVFPSYSQIGDSSAVEIRVDDANRASSNDHLLARRCANCDTTSSPLWRNGPRGPKSLCNACGIRYKKEREESSSRRRGAGREYFP